MGRLPKFAVTYLSGLIRWNARYHGYLYLLTDVYPPFSSTTIPHTRWSSPSRRPGGWNRFAVFFRFIFGVVGQPRPWPPGELRGHQHRAPHRLADHARHREAAAPLHLAYTAVLRYQTRCSCYLYLLTPTYPWKLFGDEPEGLGASTAPRPSPSSPPRQRRLATRPRRAPVRP